MSSLISPSAGEPATHVSGIAVPNLCQVADAGPRAQFAKQVVETRGPTQSRGPAVRVLNVTEHDRLRGTGLLTGRLNLTIGNRLSPRFGRAPASLDALDAQAAL